MKDWENATLEYNRTASAPLQEEVLVAVLISRSPKEVRTYLHVQVREETEKLSHVRQLLFDYPRAGKARLLKRILQILCRWMMTPCTLKVARGRKARVKARTKVIETDTTAKAKVNSHSDTLTGIATSVVSTDTRNQTCAGKSKFFSGTCNKCGAHLESESVSEPNEEPAEIESLEWLYALEHDSEEAMASLTDALVRLLLDSGSGVSACSPDFAPHVKTLTESSMRARSATGQVTKSLGKKTVNFDINGIAAGVNMEVLKISKPIVSADKMVRSGRRIVLDERNSFIEDKKTGGNEFLWS